MNNFREKRRNDRFPLDVAVLFRRFNGCQDYPATLVDCSSDGVKFTTHVKLPRGAIFMLKYIPQKGFSERQPFLPSIMVAEIKRCERTEDKQIEQYHIGARFVYGDIG